MSHGRKGRCPSRSLSTVNRRNAGGRRYIKLVVPPRGQCYRALGTACRHLRASSSDLPFRFAGRMGFSGSRILSNVPARREAANRPRASVHPRLLCSTDWNPRPAQASRLRNVLEHGTCSSPAGRRLAVASSGSATETSKCGPWQLGCARALVRTSRMLPARRIERAGSALPRMMAASRQPIMRRNPSWPRTQRIVPRRAMSLSSIRGSAV